MRLSVYLAQKYNISRRFAKLLITNGRVTMGKSVIKNDIKITDPNCNYEANIIHNNIYITDDEFLVQKTDTVIFYYKPPLIHSERHTPEDTFCMTDLTDNTGFHLISRLDYGVDGLIVAVKEEIEITLLDKNYLAWVEGTMSQIINKKFTIDAHQKRKVQVLENTGVQMIITPIKYSQGKTLVKVNIPNAARHQVRAVLAYIGFPIVDDYIYNKTDNPKRLYLHCNDIKINNSYCESPESQKFQNLF